MPLIWRPTWMRSSLVFTLAVTALSLAIWAEGGNRSYIEASPSEVVASIALTASQDTWVDEVLPDANYGASPLADVGRPDQRVTGNQQALFFFAFAGLPQGATVLTATLELWQESFSGAAQFAIRPEPIGAAWVETSVTWNTRPLTTTPVADFVFVDDITGWKAWDVTRIVTAWASGSTANGILLTGDGSTLGVRQFVTKDFVGSDTPPRLTVWYTAPDRDRTVHTHSYRDTHTLRHAYTYSHTQPNGYVRPNPHSHAYTHPNPGAPSYYHNHSDPYPHAILQAQPRSRGRPAGSHAGSAGPEQ